MVVQPEALKDTLPEYTLKTLLITSQPVFDVNASFVVGII